MADYGNILHIIEVLGAFQDTQSGMTDDFEELHNILFPVPSMRILMTCPILWITSAIVVASSLHHLPYSGSRPDSQLQTRNAQRRKERGPCEVMDPQE